MGRFLCTLMCFMSGSAAAASWMAPVTLSTPGQGTDVPQVAVASSSGEATAVWSIFDAVNAIWTVQASTKSGGVWQDVPDTIVSNGGVATRVCADPQNNVTAVSGGKWTSYAAAKLNGGTWAITGTFVENYLSPQISVAAGSTGEVIFVARTPPSDANPGIFSEISSSPGGSWTRAVGATAFASYEYNAPQAAIDASGNATAVWGVMYSGRWCIWFAEKASSSSTWSLGTSLSDEPYPLPPTNSTNPRMVLDSNGVPIVVWQAFDGTNTIIQSSTKTEGHWQNSPDNVTTTGCAQAPQVAIDGDGNATAVWQIADEDHWSVQSAVKPFGSSWGEATTLSATGSSFAPQVVVDPSGNATAVWANTDGESYTIQASTRRGGSWQETPDTLSSTDVMASSPQIGIDSSGNVTIVWWATDGTQSFIQACSNAVP